MFRSPPGVALPCCSATSRLLSRPQFSHSAPLPAPPRPLAHPAVFLGPLWPERPLDSVIWPIRLWRESRVGERGTESLRSRPKPQRTGSAPGWSPSRTIPARPGWACILYGALARLQDLLLPGDPLISKVRFGLQQSVVAGHRLWGQLAYGGLCL